MILWQNELPSTVSFTQDPRNPKDIILDSQAQFHPYLRANMSKENTVLNIGFMNIQRQTKLPSLSNYKLKFLLNTIKLTSSISKKLKFVMNLLVTAISFLILLTFCPTTLKMDMALQVLSELT